MTTVQASCADPETLRIYLILPLYHEFVNSKNYEQLHIPFARALEGLCPEPKQIVTGWLAEASIDWFEQIVCNYKNVVIHIISFKLMNKSSEANGKVKKIILISLIEIFSII